LQLFDKLIKFEFFNNTVVLWPSCIIVLQTLMVNVDPDAGVEENEQNYQKALTNFCAYLEVNGATATLVNPLVLFDFIPFIVVLPPRMSNTTSVLYLTHVYVCVSELYCLHI